MNISGKPIFILFTIILLLSLFGCSDTVEVSEPVILKCPESINYHFGEATYYNFANGSGSCSFDSTPGDLMVGAINRFDYAGSEMCGACLRVYGPKGEIKIRVVDLCPECPAGNLDLSPQAFEEIADTIQGRVPVRWVIIPCNYNDPVKIKFNDSTNQWWTAVQIRNHRYPIYSLEFLKQNKFQKVNRTNYNYFVEPGGMGPGPLIFRLTDIFGHIIKDTVKNYLPGENIRGQTQFPLCDIHSSK